MATTPPDGLAGAAGSGAPALFEFWTGPFTGRDLAVVSFTGRESISRPFCFDVSVHAPAEAHLLDLALLGQPATLLLQRAASSARCIQGIVEAIEPHVTASTAERTAYRIRIVPRLRLLKWRTSSRIFQGLTVPDIVATVLAAAPVAVTTQWKLSRDYPVRAYCLQHQETDLAFIERLLAEEGILYYFEHPTADDLAGALSSGATETVVFLDGAEGYPAIDGERSGPSPALTLRPTESMRASLDDDVQRFSLKSSLRSNATLLRDYDFRRPHLEPQAMTAVDTADPAGPAGLRVYTHRGEYEEPEVTPARAQTVLEQQRRRATEGVGESTCRRLLPGRRFTLLADTPPALAGEYVLTHVEHVGRAPELTSVGARPYEARFRCVPANVPYRPKRRKPRLRQVLESAVVVGPAGEEVHTDAYGRIKVQFHWDLYGNHNETSSCWIRVVQAWAGTGWGFQFVPRVGMEVMVTFLGGDQDCPVVTGCVYNATHPVPHLLPEHRTRSGIRTQTVPGGVGFNELAFEDRKGAEEVILRAQRNLTETIHHDRTVTVQHDDRLRVNGLMTSTVEGARVQNTGGTFAENIAGEHRRTTAGNTQINTQGIRTEKVGSDLALTVGGFETRTIGGSAAATVGKDYRLQVGGRHEVRVGSKDEEGASLRVKGDYKVDATGRVEIKADKGVVVRCGATVLEVTPALIRLLAESLALVGTKSTALFGKGPTVQLGEQLSILADKVKIAATSGLEITAEQSIRLTTPEASVILDKEAAKVNGKLVLLNCKPQIPTKVDKPKPADDKLPPGKKMLRVVAKDPGGRPYGRKSYTLLVDGQKVGERTTADDGLVEHEVSASAQRGELRIAIAPGRTLVLPLELGKLAPVDQTSGLKARLQHLGHYHGPIDETLDDEAKHAIRAFQREAGLDLTGEADAITRAKLMQMVHPE
jgi:type VI secretion system secreted protein VgrG